MSTIPVLFTKKEDCCGCGACLNICPKRAITMYEDECGFIYPIIDENKCIRCGQCKTVCAFQNRTETNIPIRCYAAVSKNSIQAEKSASAGIFAAIAENMISHGGIVYGAAFNEDWKVHHIAVKNSNHLCDLQGSKYAHSDTGKTYAEVKEQLKSGCKILYSGTPCQIAGLKGFLGQDYENLLTLDIVCHGVPSNRMLQDYLQLIGEKNGGKVEQFTFRDKSIGWGMNGSAIINGKRIKIWQSASSYLYYFTRGWIYRENCYKCKYACKHRPADITIGDFWGIEKQHPELLGKNGWDESKGISLVIVNTNKGKKAFDNTNIELKNSSFETMAIKNAQLMKPSDKGKREEIIAIYKKSNWVELDKRFNKNIGFRKYSSLLKYILPMKLKRYLKSI